MTRVFLAAGVAALAIAAPASGQRGPQEGHKDRTAQAQERGAQRAQAREQRQVQRAEREQPRVERQQARLERQQPRAEGQQMRAERQQPRMERQVQRAERQEQRMERQAPRAERAQPQRIERAQAQQAQQAQRIERVQERRAERMADRGQQVREQRQMTVQQQARAQRIDAIDDRRAERVAQRIDRAEQRALQRSDTAARRVAAFRNASTTFPTATWGNGRGNGLIDGCPPGLWMKGNNCMPPGQAAKLIGAPLASTRELMTLSALPNSMRYLYPDTDDYYYRYGDGYLYQVNRQDDLISSLIPLIAGGYIPGQYLPNMYMNSYVPDYYGFNSFYPTSYGSGYGYGYDNLCNRYANGVVYQVDCVTGMIQNVVPLYASGYGVGQMLPSSYGYYNVPNQYRDLYYDTGDYGYWYAPGAIYQYDQSSSLITSVAALLSPGFSVGQQLPMGYNTYNVPYSYRTTYYDTPNAWYRYNNGYIYQVDPTTQLVTAIVASILT